MDPANARILRVLQIDSSQPIAQLAEQLAMSTSACHRRIRAMEAEGIIEGYSARLSPRKLGLHLHVFVTITIGNQSREAMEQFEAAAGQFDEILECHLVSGAGDYLLRIAARDLDHFGELHRNSLSRLPGVTSMQSSFSIREIKRLQGYPA